MAVVSILLILPIWALATPTFEPVYKPALKTARASSPIQIDGLLTEPGWATAAQAANFVERYPGDMTLPQVPTQVYVTYDSTNFYVAFVCHDDPAQIRATMCQRDQFESDDAVCLLLDTYGAASWAYEFFVNPYGVQKDRLWSSVAGEDAGFDLNWQSAAQITDSGYQVEMAIPFANIRFPERDTHTWKIDFWRNRPRESFTQYSWAAYDRSEACWPCQWGTVDGIAIPRQVKEIEILPAFVASQSGSIPNRRDPTSHIDNKDLMGEASVGLKYSFTPDIILDGSINPDFSQIEGDAAQIDVNSTIALLYPERRPFFQEGRDIFRTLFNSFYSRSVNAPEYAAKLSARKEKTLIGFLSARDEISPYVIPLEEGDITFNGGKSTVNVLRGLYTIGNGNQVGFMAADRRFDGGGSGTIVALDGDIRLSKSYGIDGQYVLANTREPKNHSRNSFFEGSVPAGWEDSVAYYLSGMTFDGGKKTVMFDGESFWGTGLITRLKGDTRHWNFVLDYDQVSPSYRTEVGFDPYMNYRNASISSSYNIYPTSSLFEQITPRIYHLRRWNFDGERKLNMFNGGIYTQLKLAQIGLGIFANVREEVFAGRMYDGLWSVEISTDARLSKLLGYYMGANFGRQIAYNQELRGNEASAYFGASVKPIDRLNLEPTINFIQSRSLDDETELFRQLIARARVTIQATRQLSIRIVGQYNSFNFSFEDVDGWYMQKSRRWDLDPLITYRIGSFSVFYVGSTSDFRKINNMLDGQNRWRMTDRQFFMKLQYQFQA